MQVSVEVEALRELGGQYLIPNVKDDDVSFNPVAPSDCERAGKSR